MSPEPQPFRAQDPSLSQPERVFLKRGSLGALLYLPGFLVALFSPGLGAPGSVVGLLLSILGGTLVVAGVAWRSYCSFFIGGRKSVDLVAIGPYSCCRHPLYFGSFLTGLVLFAVAFLFLYRFVIQEEESVLEKNHGIEYLRFKERVPRLIFPTRFPVVEGRYLMIDLKAQANQFKRSLTTLGLVPLLALLLYWRGTGLIPVLFDLP